MRLPGSLFRSSSHCKKAGLWYVRRSLTSQPLTAAAHVCRMQYKHFRMRPAKVTAEESVKFFVSGPLLT